MSEEKKKMADDIIKHMENKLNEAKGLNAGWGKTINIVFSDIETGYAMKFAMEGGIEKIEKKPASEIKKEDAEVTLCTKVGEIKQLVDGELTGRDAYAAGYFKIDGDMSHLLKLMPCWPNPV